MIRVLCEQRGNVVIEQKVFSDTIIVRLGSICGELSELSVYSYDVFSGETLDVIVRALGLSDDKEIKAVLEIAEMARREGAMLTFTPFDD